MRLLNPILIKDVITGIKESTYEVQTESRLAYSGLKKEQNTRGYLRSTLGSTIRRAPPGTRVVQHGG